MEESKWNPITSPPGRLMPEEMDVLLDELAENNARDMGPYPPVFGPMHSQEKESTTRICVDRNFRLLWKTRTRIECLIH